MSQILSDAAMAASETCVWVLAHSLWQAGLIGMGVQVALGTLPARHAELRYRIACGGLITVVLAVFVTWSILRLHVSAPASSAAISTALITSGDPRSAVAGRVQADMSNDPRWEVPPHGVANVSSMRIDRRVTVWLTGAWFVIASIMLFRGLTGYAMVRTWSLPASHATRFGLAPLESIAKEFAERLGLRNKIRLMVCENVSVPAVIGIIWPTILVPPAMMFGVPLEQWRIIIAHELAHVHRWDALASLTQMVIESLLFFNPATWWISRQIRIEREACCDALAVQLCGRPLTVARVLVDVASAVQVVRPPTTDIAAGAMLGFADPAPGNSELTDRVQRLVAPERAPRVKVSWGSLFGLVLMIVLFAVVLQRGTDLAVTAAARLITPKERVDTLAHLELEARGILVPPADDSELIGGERTSTNDRLSANGQEQRVPVEIRVRFDDGRLVGPQLRLNSLSHNGNWTSTRALDTSGESLSEFRKTFEFAPSRLRIVASHEGWAPVVSPIVSVIPRGHDNVIELVLTKGRSVQVVVRNQDGERISGAFSRIQLNVKNGASTSSAGVVPIESQADAQGRLQFEHIGLGDYGLQVKAPGYQRFELEHSFVHDSLQSAAEAPFVVTMKRAHPTVVRVLGTDTNQPVAGARFVLVSWSSNNRSVSNQVPSDGVRPDRWVDFGETEGNGVVHLNELCDDTLYHFVILREGYGPATIELRAGEKDHVIHLNLPLRMTGHVTGQLERLRQIQRNGRQVQVFGLQRQVGQSNQSVDVEVDDAGFYSIENVVQDEQLTFAIPDQTRKIVARESMQVQDFHIKPAAVEPLLAMRDVVIRLTGTAPDAPARGSLYAMWQHSNLPDANRDIGPFILKGNEIRLSVAVGARLRFWAADLVGYRIAEQRDLEIVPGDDPQVFLAPTSPDGGIFASIMRHDGTPADSAIMTTFALQLPPHDEANAIIHPSGASSGPQFLSRVPLGGRYRVCAREVRDGSCVWAISDEVAIDETTPIRRVVIALPNGRDWRMRVLDPNGTPVIGQPVQLKVSFELNTKSNSSSTAFTLETVTAEDGYATFRGLSLDQRMTPLAVRLTVIASPAKFAGAMSFNVDLDRPVEMQLKPGVSASGVLIESDTGKPISGAEIQIAPVEMSQAEYKRAITTRTDHLGQFHFDQLERIRYRGQVKDAAAKGAVIEVQPGGGHRVRHPNGVTQLELMGGKREPVRWEVVLYPDSTLRPVK
ncbi:M56 family metallopeptidase [Schlesneria paludicola]|uniref:M56 family metallopeptidase n=1 Tax=Schlesneria paludicola TaxID=360056 RepID=UPI00029A9955|nr:M56 family metallopeptidase [Schlesneria paludicola]